MSSSSEATASSIGMRQCLLACLVSYNDLCETGNPTDSWEVLHARVTVYVPLGEQSVWLNAPLTPLFANLVKKKHLLRESQLHGYACTVPAVPPLLQASVCCCLPCLYGLCHASVGCVTFVLFNAIWMDILFVALWCSIKITIRCFAVSYDASQNIVIGRLL